MDVLRYFVSLVLAFLFTHEVNVIFILVLRIYHIEGLPSNDKTILNLRQVFSCIMDYELILFGITRDELDIPFILKDLKANFRQV